ncbi:pancreatic lipase-related protein 2-like isoform X1 [Wyeomyia smithii]|uniref:pancreatic lipase-related protein 2-like isoform X1 n=1 Tax=Wyeomyia smithii TaxID=174621 RepID=UPI0024681BF9|nr:pancreatic lipase-related protein 2-like isoform X1 [Wyeomyia smithii]
MRLTFLWFCFFGLGALVSAKRLPTPESLDFRWQITEDENGHKHLVDGELFSSPEMLFNPEKDIRFLLYTRSTADSPQRIANNDYDSVMSSQFNPNNPTRIVIHGWGGSQNSLINLNIRNELFNQGQFNFIFVDWGAGNDPFYPNSRRLVYPVGIATSNLIDYLVKVADLDRADVVVIGHSLGAHAAGNVGKGQLGRLPTIIGLDPALPFFAGDVIDRIKKTDAEHVEIIHTNGGVAGFLDPIGDADFYPNWGRIQPGCGPDVGGGCAHQRAVDYYVESIASSVGFNAVQCSSFQDIRRGICSATGETARMGGEPPNRGTAVRGVYHLSTAGERPFAMLN